MTSSRCLSCNGRGTVASLSYLDPGVTCGACGGHGWVVNTVRQPAPVAATHNYSIPMKTPEELAEFEALLDRRYEA